MELKDSTNVDASCLPRVSKPGAFIGISLMTLLVILGVYSRMLQFSPVSFIQSNFMDIEEPVTVVNLPLSQLSSSSSSSPSSSSSSSTSGAPLNSTLKVVAPGDNIQAGDLEVHIVTAAHYGDTPAQGGYNLFLNGWAKHKTPMTFKCCLLRSLPTSQQENVTFVEITSVTYHVYTQWIVDMQNAEFTCSLTKKQLSTIIDANFSHVTFAKDSCAHAPLVVMEILQPQRVPNSVGLCLKITYGTLNPEKMVEWFEYTRLMNVTKVFTFYHDVDPPVFKVLDYYRSIGYLDLLPIHPAKSKGGKDRGFRKPRYNEQAWVDEVMGANNCKHRMAYFDYVIIIDIDEYVVPRGSARNYFDVLKAAEGANPKASCFRFDSHIIMFDWGITRTSPLHLTNYTLRTEVPNYDGWDKNVRWGFRPSNTYWVQNNNCFPRKNYITSHVPDAVYMLWHYRGCKWTWTGCSERARVEDKSLLGYERQLVDRVLSLPVKEILYNSTKYVNYMLDWKKNQVKEVTVPLRKG